jgi:RNA polymerase sigma factor (sigma-70 family)
MQKEESPDLVSNNGHREEHVPFIYTGQQDRLRPCCPGIICLIVLKNNVLSQEAFDALLMWLDPDQGRAGERYESIRWSLIKFFSGRGIYDAEELADETISRVARRAHELKETYTGDPALYFYGVARNLIHEYLRARRNRLRLDSLESGSSYAYGDDFEKQLQLEALDICLNKLTKSERNLLLSYYREEKQAKIDYRKSLARKYGLSSESLRKKVQRLREKLSRDVQELLDNWGI